MVELLFLQCGKEALHTCIVAAAAGPTHALDELVTPEGREEHLAGKLAAPVGVKDRPLDIRVAAGVLQGLYTQLCSHVVVHIGTLDTAIEAVQHCRQAELPILTWNLRDVCEELFIGFLSGKVTINQLLRLFCLPVSFGDPVWTAFRPDDQAVFPTDAVDPPVAAGIAPVEPEPGNNLSDTVVAAILFIVPQALADLFQELSVSPSPLRPPEGAAVPLLAAPLVPGT